MNDTVLMIKKLKTGYALLYLFIVLSSCSALNNNLSGVYTLKNKNYEGELSINDDSSYVLRISRGMREITSVGRYEFVKGNYLSLTNTPKKDSVLIVSDNKNFIDSVKFVLTDFENIPIGGLFVTDRNKEYKAYDGSITLKLDDWKFIKIITGFVDNPDTTIVINKKMDFYHIKRNNPFLNYNKLFLDDCTMKIKSKALVNVDRKITGERLKFVLSD